ncbi:cytochrome P450 [Umezawaea sp. Da 62-37]|uniref:cytochrome P450 n=1 Tax=Umezawaea sp. Da 62-37 TaxID=3075927 RepID=UPI0028F70CA5|nr:cytochrome P450 [Umezawaea sp. Da 62-37]WNV90526.1 cytochrome P450 [Umezawaea sp. Da 62-37]
MTDPLEAREPRTFPFSAPVGLVIDPVFAELRENEPVSRIRLPHGGDAWLLTRYVDNRALLTDRRFSRTAAAGPAIPRLTVEPAGGSALSMMDGAEHARLRRMVAPAFSVRRIEKLRPGIARLTDDLLTAMLETGPPAELLEAFALPLPITVIWELLGVPQGNRDHFTGLASRLLSSTAYTREQVQDAIDELSDYLADVIAERRADPGDDLLSELVHARDVDDRLSELELVTLCGTLLGAGYENVANAIANFTVLLTEDPALMARLRAQPELVPNAVEEMLRYAMSGLGVSAPRIATEDVEIAGVLIRRGEAVFASLPSANHDPNAFADPGRVDFDRRVTGHLAFGHGAHLCLGAVLARVELRIALAAIVRRLPGLRLAVPPDEVPWKLGLTVRGPRALPVTW